MTKEEITALARKHGTSYTNRHAPGEPAFAFGNVSWVAFCDALVATAQPVQPACDTLSIGTGAVYDFAGFLTTRDKRITFSGFDESGPAVEAIKEFLDKRGISDDVSPVLDWHKVAQPVQPVSNDEIEAAVLAERKACAEILDRLYEWSAISSNYESGFNWGMQVAADLIRARSQTESIVHKEAI